MLVSFAALVLLVTSSPPTEMRAADLSSTTSPSARMSPRNATASGALVVDSKSSIIGEVRDARNRTSDTIIPDGLPPVSGIDVVIPGLARAATTDSRGRFRIDDVVVPANFPYLKLTVQVAAGGFGSWQLSGATVRPGGNYLELFVMLESSPVSLTYTPPEERGLRSERPSLLSTARVGLASIGADGCSASGSFTGYSSQVMPPGSIRVYRRSLGRIDRVNFIFYVKHVLPNEWVAGWDHSALEAGAIAVKMYGWQRLDYAPQYGQGNVAGLGCWDVDDTDNFQVYNDAVSQASTDKAVASTWPVVAYRGGTILESLYCNPAPGTPCANASTNCRRFDGLRMIQSGTQACATQASPLTWYQILQTFYDNVSIQFMGAGPGVAAPASGQRIDIFVKGSDGQIYQKYWDCSVTPCVTCWANCWVGPATPGSFGTLPPGAVSDPTAARSSAGNRLQIAVRANDNALWVNTYDSCCGWRGWTSLGGDVTAGPALAAQRNGARVDLLWRNSDNQVQQTTASDGVHWAYQPGALVALPTTPDSSAVWDPAATWRVGATTLEAFVAGNDDSEQIFQSTETGTSWSSWTGRGWGAATDPRVGGNQARPSVAAKNLADRIDLGTRGSSETLELRSATNGSWSGWTDFGTPTPNQLDSGPALTWWMNDSRIDVYVRGKDGHLWQRWSADGSIWNAWYDLGAYP